MIFSNSEIKNNNIKKSNYIDINSEILIQTANFLLKIDQ